MIKCDVSIFLLGCPSENISGILSTPYEHIYSAVFVNAYRK
jgi:hypothetical protein